METRCVHCKKIFHVPSEYLGRQVSCRSCRRSFTATHYNPPPIPFDKIAAKSRGFLAEAWKRIPRLFKAGFLTTLGALSAVFLAILFHGRLLPHGYPDPLTTTKGELSQYKLFPLSSLPQTATLRGRNLLKYVFLPDATRPDSSFDIYTDDDGQIVGFAVFWQADANGRPIVHKEDPGEWYRVNRVCQAFQKITGFHLHDLSILPFGPNSTLSEWVSYSGRSGPWRIQIDRSAAAIPPTSLPAADPALAENRRPKYSFIATAQNW